MHPPSNPASFAIHIKPFKSLELMIPIRELFGPGAVRAFFVGDPKLLNHIEQFATTGAYLSYLSYPKSIQKQHIAGCSQARLKAINKTAQPSSVHPFRQLVQLTTEAITFSCSRKEDTTETSSRAANCRDLKNKRRQLGPTKKECFGPDVLGF